MTGCVQAEEANDFLRLGIRQSRREGLRARVQGTDVKSIAELAVVLPVLVLHPENQTLLTGSPALRRAFLDWGCFYLERDFLPTWRRYQRALAQRNAAIRKGGRVGLVTAWNSELTEAAQDIDRIRADMVDRLAELVGGLFSRLFGEAFSIGLKYRRGWREDRPLSEALDADIERDRRLGNTHSGPHRAELEIEINGRPAAAVASRGQIKALTTSMILALAGVYGESMGRAAILLIDDLPAELDEERRTRLMDFLASSPYQSFVTTTDPSLLGSIPGNHRTFHVEQGQVYQSDTP